MKKYVFESLKFFCAAILCTILSAFTSPSYGALGKNLFDINNPNIFYGYYSTSTDTLSSYETNAFVYIPIDGGKTYTVSGLDRYDKTVGLRVCTVKDLPRSGITVSQIIVDQLNEQAVLTTDTDDKYLLVFVCGDSDYSGYGSVQNAINANCARLQIQEEPYNPSYSCDGTVVNYVSATGTGVQNGTPTPDNPIEPIFYQQGNMILRRVGDYADSYDATTGKITRRIGVKVLDGTETINTSTDVYSHHRYIIGLPNLTADAIDVCYSSHFIGEKTIQQLNSDATIDNAATVYNTQVWFYTSTFATADELKQWLADQYAAGTPVTIYYPLAEETTEDWTESQYCNTNTNNKITIATTKYNETAFSPLNTALQNAISVVDSVVTQTITQAGRIADLQAQKQTRPADDPTDANNAENCPAGKKCLLVEDASGIPHWYEIVERYSLLPDGYTELEYIESTGTQWIALPLAFDATDEIYARFSVNTNQTSDKYIVAPTTWNTANNRFGLGVTDTGYTMAFGAIQTSSTALSPTIRNDGNLHTWSYKNRICTVEDLNTSLDTTNIMFGATTNNLKLFFGYNSVTSGKVAYYRHKKANGTAVDLIPAKRNSDNVVGMYDTVSGEFFHGTGDFVAGPVAE